MYTLPLALAVSLALPQEPAAPLPTSLQELAARVDTAHRPKGPVPPVTAFRSAVEFDALDATASNGGYISLEIQFLLWQRPDRDREQPLIRYKVLEAGAPIVRGRDRNGPWQLFQGEPKDLRGAEFAQDLAACQKHTNLARQLVRFLDPGAVLRSLEQPSAVRDEDLRLDRNTPAVPCLVVDGRLPAFPLLQAGGDEVPVQLKLFVDKAKGHGCSPSKRRRCSTASPIRPVSSACCCSTCTNSDDLLVPRKIEALVPRRRRPRAPAVARRAAELSLRPDAARRRLRPDEELIRRSDRRSAAAPEVALELRTVVNVSTVGRPCGQLCGCSNGRRRLPATPGSRVSLEPVAAHDRRPARHRMEALGDLVAHGGARRPRRRCQHRAAACRGSTLASTAGTPCTATFAGPNGSTSSPSAAKSLLHRLQPRLLAGVTSTTVGTSRRCTCTARAACCARSRS
jgi:hypothetical protein